jgi:hypothetical protein
MPHCNSTHVLHVMSEIHFAFLKNPGDGDVFISSEFRHALDGKGWMLPMHVTIISLSIPFFGRDGWLNWFSFRRAVRFRDHYGTNQCWRDRLHSHQHNSPGQYASKLLCTLTATSGELSICPLLHSIRIRFVSILLFLSFPESNTLLMYPFSKHLFLYGKPRVYPARDEAPWCQFKGFEGDANDD